MILIQSLLLMLAFSSVRFLSQLSLVRFTLLYGFLRSFRRPSGVYLLFICIFSHPTVVLMLDALFSSLCAFHFFIFCVLLFVCFYSCIPSLSGSSLSFFFIIYCYLYFQLCYNLYCFLLPDFFSCMGFGSHQSVTCSLVWRVVLIWFIQFLKVRSPSPVSSHRSLLSSTFLDIVRYFALLVFFLIVFFTLLFRLSFTYFCSPFGLCLVAFFFFLFFISFIFVFLLVST